MNDLHVRKRRDHTQRDPSVDSHASRASRQSVRSTNQQSVQPTNQQSARSTNHRPASNRKPLAPGHKPEAVFVKPTTLPPFSQHRSVKRPRETDESFDNTEDSVAKRTRSHTQGEKRFATEPPSSDHPAKKWRSEQVSLLHYVSAYFSMHRRQQ
jgi:hypothetical protein